MAVPGERDQQNHRNDAVGRLPDERRTRELLSGFSGTRAWRNGRNRGAVSARGV